MASVECLVVVISKSTLVRNKCVVETLNVLYPFHHTVISNTGVVQTTKYPWEEAKCHLKNSPLNY